MHTLSVIITTYNARETVAQCLNSLRAQSIAGAFEIVLVDSSTDGTAELVAEHYSEVQLICFSERKFCGGARNAGIACASGNIIAFLDADCIADPRWAEAILAAHRENGDLLIGGIVDNGNPESYVGWGYYFGEFSSWMPGTLQGHVEEIPGCVLTLKRAAFERYGPFIEGTYCSDSALHWLMAYDGHRPLLVPAIRVAHLNPSDLDHFAAHAVRHGRNFGTVRSREQEWSTAKRWLHVLTAPLLPILLFVRTLRDVARTGKHLPRFLSTAPIVLLGQIAWSLGEVQGYLPRRRSSQNSERTLARQAVN